MQESRTSGFVRGAHSNMCPYRDPSWPEFLDAAALRGPQVGQFVRDQALKRFGQAAPSIQINFVSREQVRQQKVLDALPAPAPTDAAKPS